MHAYGRGECETRDNQSKSAVQRCNPSEKGTCPVTDVETGHRNRQFFMYNQIPIFCQPILSLSSVHPCSSCRRYDLRNACRHVPVSHRSKQFCNLHKLSFQQLAHICILPRPSGRAGNTGPIRRAQTFPPFLPGPTRELCL